jgi:hypothetical protein
MEEEVWKVVTNTIGYKLEQAKNKWFNEECANVNEEKNAIQRRTRTAYSKYRQTRSNEKYMFRKKSRQLDDEVLLWIERHRSN